MFRTRLRPLSLFAILLLAACSGGGGGNGGGGVTPPAQMGTAHFTITDPYSTQSTARKPEYFSHYTASLEIVVNSVTTAVVLNASSPLCSLSGSTLTCAFSLSVPNGPLSFTVKALDTAQNVLSQATGTATINGTTTIPLALDPVWKTATARLANEHPPVDTDSSVVVNVNGYDVDGALIVGPEPYTSPIPVYDWDTSGATKLSTSSATTPGQTITLSYDGSYTNARVSTVPSTQQDDGYGDLLVPALRATEYAIPSGESTDAEFGARILADPDGTMTFMEGHQKLGRVTQSGVITETTTPEFYYDITLGTDGNVWLLENACSACSPDNKAIARFNADGTFTELPMLPSTALQTLITGGDGDFYVPSLGADGDADLLQKVTPTGTASTVDAGLVDNYPTEVDLIQDAATGSDGNVWLLIDGSTVMKMAKISPAGTATSYVIPEADWLSNQLSNPIVLGPDGQMYMPDSTVVRVATDGTFSSIAANVFPTSAVARPGFGPDGALWIPTIVGSSCDPAVQRVTPAGASATFMIPLPCDPASARLSPVGALASGDGFLWYTRGAFVGKIQL